MCMYVCITCPRNAKGYALLFSGYANVIRVGNTWCYGCLVPFCFNNIVAALLNLL